MRDMGEKLMKFVYMERDLQLGHYSLQSCARDFHDSCIGDMFDRDTTDNLIARYIINKSEDTSALRKGSLLDYLKLLGVVQQISEKETNDA